MPTPSGGALSPRPHPTARPLRLLAEAVGAAVPGAGPAGSARADSAQAGSAQAGADEAAAATSVSGVSLDSRGVRPGDLYAALPGARTHGAAFCAQAVAAGAVAVLTDPAGAEAASGAGVPVLVVEDPRAVLGRLCVAVYGDPGDGLLLLGVTGTNGKTTTTFLLDGVLRAAGWLTGLVGTVETRVGDERLPSVRTTPEAPDLHAFLAVLRERGARACSLEVSSHALALHRVDGVVVDVAAFTNLSRDHLDFHPDVEDYFATKARLFTPEHSRRGVVCVDDEWGRRLAATAGVPVTTVTTRPGPDAAADWTVTERRPRPSGATAFVLTGRDGRRLELSSPLPGEFNVANSALAAVVLLEAGLGADDVVTGLERAGGVPGRMERVDAGPGGPLAVVDYAHSPDAVAAALRALRPATPGRLVVVLGAGGDRDRGKRPGMGRAAAENADVVVVTDDNPRSEDPAAIRAAVLAGAREAGGSAQVLEVADRAAAVAAAVAQVSGPADTVLVAGKGHELGQEVAGVVHPFDDRRSLAAALAAAGFPAAGGTASARGDAGAGPGRERVSG